MDIGVKDGRIVGVRGRKSDRVNHGRLGPKGLNSWVANRSPDRLTHPLIRDPQTGQLVRASWDQAMDRIVQKSKEIIKTITTHGIGFYTTGQLFLEEYYALAMIGKAGLRTLHMDGNTRLCTATGQSVVAYIHHSHHRQYTAPFCYTSCRTFFCCVSACVTK